VSKIRVAIENKIRPTAVLFHEQPFDPWTKFDFLLLEAYQTLQDETCSQCGNPIWICRNEDATNVGFKIKTTVCFAKAELERHNEMKEKKKSKKKNYGESDYVVAYTYDGGEMPTRSSYFAYLAEKMKAEEES
jgi:hypothetical protein